MYNDDLLRQYETVRQSGLCNMFDRKCVHNVAEQLELDELADVSSTNGKYAGLIEHFATVGHDNPQRSN